MTGAGPLGFLILAFLPGAWLAFGLPLSGAGSLVRVALAVVLSPVVVLVQFYVVRLLGASFAAAGMILVIGNLAAAVPVYRRITASGIVMNLPRVALYVLVWAVPLGVLVALWSDWRISAISAHTFLHSDIVYAIANGQLRVEDAQLAGIHLGYPWGGHVQQALLSWVMGRAPAGTFPLTNMALLLAAVTLIGQVTARLGGGLRAQLLTVICVLFAVNAVGYVLQHYLLPIELVSRAPVWGDERFTPWLRKYVFWSQHPASHGLLAGVLFVLAGPRSERLTSSTLLLLGTLLIGLAVIYPVLMPPALALLAARFVAVVFPRAAPGAAGTAVRLAALTLIGVAATAVMLMLLSADRAAGTGLSLSTLWELKVKSVEAVIALSLLGAGAVYFLVTRRAHLPDQVSLPLLGGAASAFLFVLFSIPPGRNEYKFILTAAMCLAPVAALGLDALVARGGAVRVALAGALLAFPVWAGSYPLVRERYRGPIPLDVRVDAFGLRLSPEHPQAASLAAIAEQTPASTIVVVDSTQVHVPAFVRRAMYAPPLMDVAYLGVGLQTLDLLESVRGYGRDVVAQRVNVTRRLFQAADASDRSVALQTIEGMRRPVAVLLDQSRQARLTQELVDSASGTVIHHDARWVVWLWTPP